jgi:hypothetical protein
VESLARIKEAVMQKLPNHRHVIKESKRLIKRELFGNQLKSVFFNYSDENLAKVITTLNWILENAGKLHDHPQYSDDGICFIVLKRASFSITYELMKRWDYFSITPRASRAVTYPVPSLTKYYPMLRQGKLAELDYTELSPRIAFNYQDHKWEGEYLALRKHLVRHLLVHYLAEQRRRAAVKRRQLNSRHNSI